MGVFEKFIPKAYPFVYDVEVTLDNIAGATPTDPKIAEGWIKSKVTPDNDALIQQQVAEIMLERGVTADAAAEELAKNKHLTGFKKTEEGFLYLEGRCVKACLKESTNIRFPWPDKKWGPSKKSSMGFFPEHVFVNEDKILFKIDGEHVKVPTGINQRFVHSRWGAAIQYEEYLRDATLEFSVVSDFRFEEEEWGMIWLTAQMNGLGASRSQGFGRFDVTKWDRRS